MFAHAQWFFGNLYESVARVPHRLAAAESSQELRRSPLAPGSPARYYIPVILGTFPTAVAALAAGWKGGGRRSRRWLVLGAISSLSGGAATAYLVRSVNPQLFFGDQPLSEMRRRPLLRKWHRLNTVRIASSCVAWVALRQAKLAVARRGLGRGPA